MQLMFRINITPWVYEASGNCTIALTQLNIVFTTPITDADYVAEV